MAQFRATHSSRFVSVHRLFILAVPNIPTVFCSESQTGMKFRLSIPCGRPQRRRRLPPPLRFGSAEYQAAFGYGFLFQGESAEYKPAMQFDGRRHSMGRPDFEFIGGKSAIADFFLLYTFLMAEKIFK